jgi:hypothetical protein
MSKKKRTPGGPMTELGALRILDVKEFRRRIIAAMQGDSLLTDAAFMLGVSVPSLKVYLSTDPVLRGMKRRGRGQPKTSLPDKSSGRAKKKVAR